MKFLIYRKTSNMRKKRAIIKYELQDSSHKKTNLSTLKT